MSGAAGHQRDGGAPGDAGPGVGGVGGGGFVAGVDDADTGAGGFGKYLVEVVPYQGEEAVHAQL